MSEIEAVEIERLVTGRLPADERALLLSWADDHPENWRLIASAFLEEQSLATSLRSDLEPASALKPPRSAHRSETYKSMALAACVVLLIGSLLGHAWQASHPDKERLIVDGTASRGPSVDGPLSSDTPSDDAVIFVVDRTAVGPAAESATNRMSTPPDTSSAAISDLERLIRQMREPVIDPPLREVLVSHGLRAVEEPNLYLVADDSGKTYAVPKRRISFVPISHEP